MEAKKVEGTGDQGRKPDRLVPSPQKYPNSRQKMAGISKWRRKRWREPGTRDGNQIAWYQVLRNIQIPTKKWLEFNTNFLVWWKIFDKTPSSSHSPWLAKLGKYIHNILKTKQEIYFSNSIHFLNIFVM